MLELKLKLKLKYSGTDDDVEPVLESRTEREPIYPNGIHMVLRRIFSHQSASRWIVKLRIQFRLISATRYLGSKMCRLWLAGLYLPAEELSHLFFYELKLCSGSNNE